MYMCYCLKFHNPVLHYLSLLFSQHFCPLCRKCGYLLPQSPELFFVGTELFRAVCAFKIIIGIFGKSFGMPVKDKLPTDHQSKGKNKKPP